MIYKANDKDLINEKEFLDEYWNKKKKLLFDKRKYKDLLFIRDLFRNIDKRNGKIIFVGNGASASLSSHAATDLTTRKD